MTDKERIICFLEKFIPENFKCGHISVTFNDDDSAVITLNNREYNESLKDVAKNSTP